jgi:hypothetical protein
MSDQAVRAFLRALLKDRPETAEGADVGNSVAGSLVNLLYHVPRWRAEALVLEAQRSLRQPAPEA